MTDQEITALAEAHGINMRPMHSWIEMDKEKIGRYRWEQSSELHYAGQRILNFAKALLEAQ